MNIMEGQIQLFDLLKFDSNGKPIQNQPRDLTPSMFRWYDGYGQVQTIYEVLYNPQSAYVISDLYDLHSIHIHVEEMEDGTLRLGKSIWLWRPDKCVCVDHTIDGAVDVLQKDCPGVYEYILNRIENIQKTNVA